MFLGITVWQTLTAYDLTTSFRLLFDKIAYVYFILEIFLYLALEMASPEN